MDYILIELDRERKLKLTYKALKHYKVKFGKSLGSSSSDSNDFDIEEMARILYVGLIHEDPALTFEQVEGMIDEKPLSYCISKMTELTQTITEKNEIAPKQIKTKK